MNNQTDAILFEKYARWLRGNTDNGVLCKDEIFDSGWPLHKHDYIEIEYIVEGNIINVIDGYEYELGPGDFYIVGYDNCHRLMPGEVHMRSLFLDAGKTSRNISWMLSQATLPCVGCLAGEQLDEMNRDFLRLQHEIGTDNKYASERVAAIATVMISNFLLNVSGNMTKTSYPDGYSYVKKAVAYIEENCTQEISLESVSSYIGVSKGYLCGLFAKFAGCGFSEYLSRTRIERSKPLLSDTKRSIIEIALAVGFGSYCNFSRHFLKFCGITPREYRRRMTENTKNK